jgi:hypothetical protein
LPGLRYGGAAFGGGLDEAFIVSEGWAVGTKQVEAKMAKFDARQAVFLTALRHPVNRILSRYWYEGRWEMGRDATDLSAKGLEEWLDAVEAAEAKAPKVQARLWACVSNYYVTSLAGWQVGTRAHRHHAQRGRGGEVGGGPT